jgi:2,3-bisphosphoglycerate-independent phosphoglycerate mutase
LHPIVLVILDGLGDRQHAELDGFTPLEVAATPSLDALAASGVCGLMWPLGPGRAPSTPLAHWELFGADRVSFPGRGSLEALGEGLEPQPGEVVVRINFMAVEERDGVFEITSRPDPRFEPDTNDDVDLDGEFDGVRARFVHTGHAQGLLFLHPDAGRLSVEVTDADPLRDGASVRSVLPLAEARDAAAAARTAVTLNAWMLEAHGRLRGRALDFAAVKWPGALAATVPFSQRTGLTGASLARGELLEGLARAAGLDPLAGPELEDQGITMRSDVGHALQLLRDGYDFVHVHTKWTDTAAHKKIPERKREVIELLDAAFAPNVDALIQSGAVVCVTADHQTPSSGPLYHSGGAVPVLIRGGVAGRDHVTTFSERGCLGGSLGHIRGSDLMPLLLDCADRSAFMAERYTAVECLGTARDDDVVPLRPKR